MIEETIKNTDEKVCYLNSQIKDKINPKPSINWSRRYYRHMLKIQDRNMCINRYIWKDLERYTPITSQQFEGMVYDNGCICGFKEYESLMLMKFNRLGTINDYGQLHKIRPISWQGKTYKDRYGITSLDGTEHMEEDTALILCDYTPFLSTDFIIPRSVINEKTTINDQVQCYKTLYYELMLSIKKALIKVENEEQSQTMIRQMENMLDSSNPIFALATGFDIANVTELFNLNNNIRSQDLISSLDFYYKARRAFNGIPAPDSFEKKERKVASETAGAHTHTLLVLDNGLQERKIFAKRCKECYNINIDVEINPIIQKMMEEKENVDKNVSGRNIPHNNTI